MERSKSQSEVKDRKKKKKKKKKEPGEIGTCPNERGRDEERHKFYLLKLRYDEYTPLTNKKETILKGLYNAQLIGLPHNVRKQQVPTELIGMNGVNSVEIMVTLRKIGPF